jgi:hypothetical protein
MSEDAKVDQALPPILQRRRLSFFNGWTPVYDEDQIDEWICPQCNSLIGFQNSGRGICQKCGLSVRESLVLRPEKPRSEKMRNWKNFIDNI